MSVHRGVPGPRGSGSGGMPGPGGEGVSSPRGVELPRTATAAAVRILLECILVQ